MIKDALLELKDDWNMTVGSETNILKMKGDINKGVPSVVYVDLLEGSCNDTKVEVMTSDDDGTSWDDVGTFSITHDVSTDGPKEFVFPFSSEMSGKWVKAVGGGNAGVGVKARIGISYKI